MIYSNPFQSMMPPGFPQSMMPAAQPQQNQVPINPQQFAAVAATLNQQSLNQLVQMARQRGISETDINAGLNFIQSFR